MCPFCVRALLLSPTTAKGVTAALRDDVALDDEHVKPQGIVRIREGVAIELPWASVYGELPA
jgi:hypothetical protein